MTVAEIKALAKGTKIENLTGVFAKISAFRTTATKKIRQTALLQDNTGEIQMVIWGGQIDKFLYGSVFNIKVAYVDVYNRKTRLTVNKNEDVTLVQAKAGYTPKGQQSAPSETKVTPPATTPAPTTPQASPEKAETGAIEPQKVPIASTDKEEVKLIMKECIADVKELTADLGLTAENFVAMIDTMFIERNKRIRQDKY